MLTNIQQQKRLQSIASCHFEEIFTNLISKKASK